MKNINETPFRISGFYLLSFIKQYMIYINHMLTSTYNVIRCLLTSNTRQLYCKKKKKLLEKLKCTYNRWSFLCETFFFVFILLVFLLIFCGLQASSVWRVESCTPCLREDTENTRDQRIVELNIITFSRLWNVLPFAQKRLQLLPYFVVRFYLGERYVNQLNISVSSQRYKKYCSLWAISTSISDRQKCLTSKRFCSIVNTS